MNGRNMLVITMSCSHILTSKRICWSVKKKKITQNYTWFPWNRNVTVLFPLTSKTCQPYGVHQQWGKSTISTQKVKSHENIKYTQRDEILHSSGYVSSNTEIKYPQKQAKKKKSQIWCKENLRYPVQGLYSRVRFWGASSPLCSSKHKVAIMHTHKKYTEWTTEK